MSKENRKLSAASVIFNPSGAVLMGLKLKYGQWEFPGGKIEPNEPILHGAQRELAEETGIMTQKYEFLQFLDHPKWLCFAYAGITRDEPRKMEPDKHGEWAWFSFADVNRMLRQDQVTSVTRLVCTKWILAGLSRCYERGWIPSANGL